MEQDGGTRGGTFHDEMDRCRESQRWTTTSSSSSSRVCLDVVRGGQDQGRTGCSLNKATVSAFVLDFSTQSIVMIIINS